MWEVGWLTSEWRGGALSLFLMATLVDRDPSSPGRRELVGLSMRPHALPPPLPTTSLNLHLTAHDFHRETWALGISIRCLKVPNVKGFKLSVNVFYFSANKPFRCLLLVIYFICCFFLILKAIHNQFKNLEMLKSTKKKVKITSNHRIHSMNLYLLHLLYGRDYRYQYCECLWSRFRNTREY